LSYVIPIPLLVFGFIVLVGTIAGVTWLHLRRGPRIDIGNAPVAPPDPWLRIPYLDALFDLPRRLPGVYRPVGTWIGTGLVLVTAACFMWESSGAGLTLAILSNCYMEQAMERALGGGAKGDWHIPGLIFSIAVLVAGVVASLIHAVFLMQRYFG